MKQRNIRSVFLVSSIAILFQTISGAIAKESPIGIWMDHSGRGAIEIQPCGDKLCGHLVWMKESQDTEGCGAQIIGEARQVKEGLWDDGWIYSPEKNRKYDVELKPLPNGTLRVKGYAGSKMFSRTMIWKPAPLDLKLCQNKSKNLNQTVQQNRPETSEAQEKIAKADPSAPSEDNTLTEEMPTSETTSPFLSKGEKQAIEKSKTPQKALNKEREFDNSSSTTKAETFIEDPRPQDKKLKTAQSGFSTSSVKQSLDDLQRQTGFGIKKIGNGSCRLKVPFVTIRIRCED